MSAENNTLLHEKQTSFHHFQGKEVRHTVLWVIFVIICWLQIVLGSLGNLSILVVVCTQKKISNHNLFIAHLAVTDLVTLGYWWPFFAVDLIVGYHPVVNRAHCQANGVIIVTVSEVYVMILIFISLNRYVHICHFGRYSTIFSRRHTTFALVLIWLSGFGLSTVPFLFKRSPYAYSEESRVCAIDDTHHVLKLMFNIMYVVSPLVVVGYLNGAIYRVFEKVNDTLVEQYRKESEEMSKSPLREAQPSENAIQNTDTIKITKSLERTIIDTLEETLTSRTGGDYISSFITTSSLPDSTDVSISDASGLTANSVDYDAKPAQVAPDNKKYGFVASVNEPTQKDNPGNKKDGFVASLNKPTQKDNPGNKKDGFVASLNKPTQKDNPGNKKDGFVASLNEPTQKDNPGKKKDGFVASLNQPTQKDNPGNKKDGFVASLNKPTQKDNPGNKKDGFVASLNKPTQKDNPGNKKDGFVASLNKPTQKDNPGNKKDGFVASLNEPTQKDNPENKKDGFVACVNKPTQVTPPDNKNDNNDTDRRDSTSMIKAIFWRWRNKKVDLNFKSTGSFLALASERRLDRLKDREQLVVRSLLIVYVMTCISFGPYGMMCVANYLTTVPPEVLMGVNILLYFTNACNWIVYGYMNPTIIEKYMELWARVHMFATRRE